jgi:hypothetical protein
MLTTPLDRLVPADAAARLLAFRDAVCRACPGLVRDIILFGSRARGDASTDSDYDVAVLLDAGVAEDSVVRRRIADAAWEHAADGYAITPIRLDADALTQAGRARSEVATRIALEGISIR